MGRDPALVPGRCNPHTKVGVTVLPICLGSGSDPAPGTFKLFYSAGGPTCGLPSLRVAGSRLWRHGLPVKQFTQICDEGRIKEVKPDGGAQEQKDRQPPKPMPERIPDTPENIMRALVNTPLKTAKDWDSRS